MIPDRYDLKKHTTDDDGGGVRDESIYQGDSYAGPLVTLPLDLSTLVVDGPDDISDATFTAQVRTLDGTLAGDFVVTVEDSDAETVSVRPTMTPAESAGLPITSGLGHTTKAYWDLQASKAGWVGTFVRGEVKILREETE